MNPRPEQSKYAVAPQRLRRSVVMASHNFRWGIDHRRGTHYPTELLLGAVLDVDVVVFQEMFVQDDAPGWLDFPEEERGMTLFAAGTVSPVSGSDHLAVAARIDLS